MGIGLWPWDWENTSFVQDLQEMEPNPVGISPWSGSTTLSLGGGVMGSPAILLGQAQQAAALAPLRDDGTAMLSGRHNVATVP